MRLTHADLKEMPIEEIVVIAREKLDRFKALPSEKQGPWKKAIPLLEAIFTGVAANLTTDLIQSADWDKLFREAFDFLNQIMP